MHTSFLATCEVKTSLAYAQAKIKACQKDIMHEYIVWYVFLQNAFF